MMGIAYLELNIGHQLSESNSPTSKVFINYALELLQSKFSEFKSLNRN